ncbi:MAG: hypothetical protein IPL76_14165 [Gemmatimonadetes bacterium]|nr:hypothetical protein [Gemmatimonadota bacterium]
MTRRGLVAALALLAGCSDISGSKGVVALELRLPSPPVVEPLDTLTLHAVAYDIDGDSLDLPVYWRTPDTTLILVDSAGRLTTALTSGTGRVQARAGNLYSAVSSPAFTIRPRSDTLRLTVPDTLTILAGDTASGPLDVALESNDPAGGISGASILYEVVDTAAARGLVRFAGDVLVFRATTATGGTPSPAVTLRKVPGATPPATVQVRVSATRPSGTPVPGSGQLFTLTFP